MQEKALIVCNSAARAENCAEISVQNGSLNIAYFLGVKNANV